MKLFIVAFCLLLAVTNGFQPLLATKMMAPIAAPKKATTMAKKVVAPKIIMKKVEAKPKKTVSKTPPLDKKKVVAPTAPAKKVVAPTAPAKKIENKKTVFGVKKELVAPEKKYQSIKFFYDKL
jgi:hypothetical protein